MNNNKKHPYTSSVEFTKSERSIKEEAILAFWQKNDIFKKSLEQTKDGEEFIFYEGPPTANGRPGIHHVESRSFKDAVPRFQTMRGKHVKRKGGWDTHGLPVELQVEKKLGFTQKKDIEEYGVHKFNTLCKQSVWDYIEEWTDFTKRLGYWVDLENPYITYRAPYIESLWSIFKKIEDQGLLYQDFRVAPWCPRCGTVLSSHEVADGYKTVKDNSVTAKFKLVSQPNTYVLAWTTTPWTLPGNVALAVGEDIVYVKAKQHDEFYIVAKDLVDVLEGEYEIVEEFLGKKLINEKYQPVFTYLKDMMSADASFIESQEKAFTIYKADFVTTDSGTGVVHTAVMYGQDDFELGTALGLPKLHTVNQDGTFVEGVTDLAGKFVKDLETEIEIFKLLHAKNALYKKRKYEHTYPHCWRCKTPLIYFARESWYVRMSQLQNEMVAGNSTINWEPSHIREGRFGEWLRGVKDWAISRERYWGTPLPIWRTADGKKRLVIGSYEELKRHMRHNGNTFVAMRHGQAQSNVDHIVSTKVDNPHHLTKTGKEQVMQAIESLKNMGITKIVASPFVRTKETAKLVQQGLGLDDSAVVFDQRLGEINAANLEGKSIDMYHQLFADNPNHSMQAVVAEGESFLDIKRRMGEVLFELDNANKNEKVLILSHGTPLWLLTAAAAGYDNRQTQAMTDQGFKVFKNAEVRVLDFVGAFPHNENFELDPHRPFIDDVLLYDDNGDEYTRVSEVADVWFDSGAMPYAQNHYPFENVDWVENHAVPADYICEAIDQTRGWFYTLHAVAALMGKPQAYKNVISLGHILDEEGLKMSKSKGNTINPWDMIEKYGVDVLRYWMYTVNQPGDSKSFDERSVQDVSRKVFGLLENSTKFYQMFAKDVAGIISDNPFDVWLLSYVYQTKQKVTQLFEDFKILEAARLLRELIGDVSQWYIQNNRDRFKADNNDMPVATLQLALQQIAIMLAPLAPFMAEDVWQRIKNDNWSESVHIAGWGADIKDVIDKDILQAMTMVRELSSQALEARSKTGIKVRQPLASVSISIAHQNIVKLQWVERLLKERLNVLGINTTDNADEIIFDTVLTKQLEQMGDTRELVRAVQQLRKKAGLQAGDKVKVQLSVKTDWIHNLSEVKETIGASDIEQVNKIEDAVTVKTHQGEVYVAIVY